MSEKPEKHDPTARKRFGVLPAPRPVVTVLGLAGPIGATGRPGKSLTAAKLEKPIETAFKPKHLKAVALAVNSPGGSPVQSKMIHDMIRAKAAERKVRVLTYVEDLAASGGYMLAVAGDEILADPSSLVGSIGVVSGGFGFPEALSKLGVERRTYTAGENKIRLDPFKPEKPEDVAWIEGLMAKVHEVFVDLVKARRGAKLSSETDLFQGDVWIAAEATRLGLIDGTASMVEDLKRRFGDRVKIERVSAETKPLIARLVGAQAGLGVKSGLGVAPDEVLAAAEERAMWSRYGL